MSQICTAIEQVGASTRIVQDACFVARKPSEYGPMHPDVTVPRQLAGSLLHTAIRAGTGLAAAAPPSLRSVPPVATILNAGRSAA